MNIVEKTIHNDALRQHVIDSLTMYGARQKGNEMLVICPWHADHDPSLRIHIGDKVSPGSYYCFVCKAHGGWNAFASKVGLTTFGKNSVDYNSIDPFNIINRALKKDLTPTDEPILRGLEELPYGFKWRGLNRAFYSSLGGRYWYDLKRDIEYLYFPLTMNLRYMGYTLCNLTRAPGQLSYLTMGEAQKILFMYDQIKNGETIFLVEGHFDCLRMIAEGFQAVGVFGTANWSPIKKASIEAKMPKQVVILYDGDKPGYEAAQEIYKDLRESLNVDIYYLPISDAKIDPGSMPQSFIDDIRNKYGL